MLPNKIEFRAKQARCNKLLQDALAFSQKPHVVGSLKSYQYLNSAVFSRLANLENCAIIFTTSESRSPTGYSCVDIFSEHFELGDRLLEMENELYKEFGPSKKQVLYFPVAPILFPAVTAYDNGDVIFKFPFPEVFGKVNKRLPEKQRVSEVSLERRLNQDSEGQKGIYQFKTLLFESDAAKKILIDREGKSDPEINAEERLLEDCTYINRVLIGNAYASIMQKLGLDGKIPLYSEEGGYAAQIFDAADIQRTTFGQVTRNLSGDQAKYGTSAHSALDILKSYVHHIRYEV
jgi:hypothetical protein